MIDWCLRPGREYLSWNRGVTIGAEGLQIIGLCPSHTGFLQVTVFIVPHLLRHRVSDFAIYSEGPPKYPDTQISCHIRQVTYTYPCILLPGALRDENECSKLHTVKCQLYMCVHRDKQHNLDTPFAFFKNGRYLQVRKFNKLSKGNISEIVLILVVLTWFSDPQLCSINTIKWIMLISEGFKSLNSMSSNCSIWSAQCLSFAYKYLIHAKKWQNIAPLMTLQQFFFESGNSLFSNQIKLVYSYTYKQNLKKIW